MRDVQENPRNSNSPSHWAATFSCAHGTMLCSRLVFLLAMGTEALPLIPVRRGPKTFAYTSPTSCSQGLSVSWNQAPNPKSHLGASHPRAGLVFQEIAHTSSHWIMASFPSLLSLACQYPAGILAKTLGLLPVFLQYIYCYPLTHLFLRLFALNAFSLISCLPNISKSNSYMPTKTSFSFLNKHLEGSRQAWGHKVNDTGPAK